MKKTIYFILALCLSLVILLSFSVVGCKEEAPAEEVKVEEAPADKVEEAPADKEEEAEEISANLRILWPGTSEAEKELAAYLQDLVKTEYPNINIEYIMLVWADIEKKLVTMTQAGDFPDLMEIQDVTNPVAMDVLEPLDSYFNDKLKKDMFIKAPLEVMQVDGTQYAIPGLSVGFVHVVNIEMLQAAGMKIEDLNTWDGFKEAVKAMTKDGKYGYAMANGGEGRFTFRDFEMICLSNGITPDDVSDNSKKQYLEVLDLLYYMADYMPESQITWQYTELYKAWEDGLMGMMHSATYYAANAISHGTNSFARTVPFSFPAGPSVDNSQVMVGSAGFSIIKGSDQKEAAWKVIEIIMSNEFVSKWSSAVNIPAVNYIPKDVLEEAAKEAYPDIWEEHLRINDTMTDIISENGVPIPKILGQPQMEKIVQDAIIKMLNKKMTPEEAYGEIKEGVEGVKASFK